MRFLNLEKRIGAYATTLVLVGFVMNGCSPKRGDMVVATIGEQPIKLKDYEALYVKSNGSVEHGRNASLADREKFLELMLKFRLKLADAYSGGLSTSPEVLSEIDQYKGSLAASYLTEREMTRPALERMYKRKNEEIRASHILLSLSPTTASEESLATATRAYELIAAIKKGASFDSLAALHSQDPSAKTNNGDLYYFTAGQMVPSFEDAVYTMKVGEVTSHPVRTQYGFHVIKVVDKKEAGGERRVSHIMVRFEAQDPSAEDTLKAFQRINQLADSLKLGIDFAELAIRNSGDPGSASRGGDLGQFPRRRYPQPFDEMSFLLKLNEVSPVVRTQYGYHLIKCTEIISPKSFDEVKSELQQAYQQQRFPDEFKKYMERLKGETKFRLDATVASEFISGLDSTKTTRDSAWGSSASSAVGKKPIIWLGQSPITVDSVLAHLNARPDLGGVPLRSAQVVTLLDKVTEHLVFTTKASSLERTDPEFAAIMKEYRDGILLYQIEQNRVWGSINVNDSLLQAYFEKNRDKFRWPDRVSISEIKILRDTLAHALFKRVQSGATLESLAAEDSMRMAMPTNYQAIFTGGSTKLTKQTNSAAQTISDELTSDQSLRVHLTAYPDTIRAKESNTSLSNRRVAALKSALTKKYGIAESRITTSVRPSAAPKDEEQINEIRLKSNRIDIDITGRRAVIIGGVQSGIHSITLDERTKRADSLQTGGVAPPFFVKGNYVIVRLNGKEPSRNKTYDEAGTEVSSAFQEYESKRLESEWLSGLRKRFPVVENREVLNHAFATEK